VLIAWIPLPGMVLAAITLVVARLLAMLYLIPYCRHIEQGLGEEL